MGRCCFRTVVTVTVTSSYSKSGVRRHVGLSEPEAWARAVFVDFAEDDRKRIYLLGGNNPDAGRPEHGLVVYRFYLDEDSTPIRVPRNWSARPTTGSARCTEPDSPGPNTIHHFW